ncbi:hypothetical protein B7494_g2989 [Chlorociboria aeruginascens]|nr:hypothetical protein B7494_g2989 [Chlorociboria aeruginascens]
MFRICLVSSRSALLHRYLLAAPSIRHFHCTPTVFDRSKTVSLDSPRLSELISTEHPGLSVSAECTESLPSAREKVAGRKTTSADENGTAPSASHGRNYSPSKAAELPPSPERLQKETTTLPEPNSEQPAPLEDLNPLLRHRNKNDIFEESTQALGTTGISEVSEPQIQPQKKRRGRPKGAPNKRKAADPSSPEVLEGSESQIQPRKERKGRLKGTLDKKIAVDPPALEDLESQIQPRKKRSERPKGAPNKKKGMDLFSLEVSEGSESQTNPHEQRRGRRLGSQNNRVASDSYALAMPELIRVGRIVRKNPVLNGPNADSEQLRQVRRLFYQRVKGDKRRINIVGKSLCDDILERMKPSLEKHIGCDILDINPGAGLWSSKLHDFLKPRTHILMEPDTDMYLPLLQPLLDAEGSTYKLIPKSGTVWAHLNRAISDEFLPHQPKFVSGDPRLEEPNDTLLVIANLGYYPKKSFRGFPSLSSLVMHQFLSAIRHHSLFEQKGLVRILIWCGDDEKDVVLPRSASQVSKSSHEAMLSAHIEEIAGSGEYAIGNLRVVTRDANLDLESSSRVLKKMETAGTVTPENRQTRFQRLALLKSTGNVDQALPSYNRSYHNQLKVMEEDFAAGRFDKYMPPIGRENDGRGRERHTPQMRRLQYLRARDRTDDLNRLAYEKAATEWEALRALQIEVDRIGDTTEAQRRQKKVDRRLEEWKANMESKLDTMQRAIWAYIEDRRAMELDPPLLLWDRREAEPLKVQDEEFYPSQKMCLLDIHPKSMWPVLRRNDSRDYDFMEFILKYFYMTPSHSVEKGLLSLFPGAQEWILPRCPSLVNTAKGGCRDLSLLSVRSLTEEMLKEIVEAFMDWPFRPKRHELISRLGSEVYDPDDLD